MIEWIRAADSLKSVTSGGTGWTMSGSEAVTFQKSQRQCIAFVRNGQPNWILGAALCRESASPISPNEAAFIADAIKVR